MADSAPPSKESQDEVRSKSEPIQVRLTEELLSLRSREGLVFERMKTCKALKAVAKIWKQSQAPALGALDDSNAAIEMVKHFLDLERPIEHRDSLKVAYGLIVHGRSRDDRVRRYLELPNDQKTVFSESSIERHSRTMAAQLAARLTSTAVSTRGNAAPDESVCNTRPIGEYLTPPLRVDHAIRLVRFGPNRIIADSLSLLYLVALEDGVHTRRVSWEYLSDHRVGAVEIVPEYGCDFAADPVTEDGAIHVELRIPRMLRKGDSHLLSFRAVFHSNEQAEPPFINLTPTQDMVRYELHAQFHDDSVPSALWSFADLNHYQLRLSELRKQTPLSHSGASFASKEWRNLRAGFCYGFTWEW